MLKVHCDRCPNSAGPVEAFAAIPTSPYANVANGAIPAMVQLPEGWSLVHGKHLCDKCTNNLMLWMHRAPEFAQR